MDAMAIGASAGAVSTAAAGIVVLNAIGFPEAEGAEAVGGIGYAIWAGLAGEPVTTYITTTTLFGMLGSGPGAAVGLAVTTSPLF